MSEPKSIARVNTQELLFMLDHMPKSRNLMVFGPHGVGKSQIVTAYYESKGYEVVSLFLGQMSDPGDLIGLPCKKEIALPDGTKTEVMDFLPPAWWQEEKPFCLFLDEINRGRPEILNVIMDLALNKKLVNRKLPEGSIIVAAGNVGDGYTVQDLDPALLDRFAPAIFKPTVDEWLTWGSKKGIDQRVIDFITDNNEWLDGDQIETEDPMDVTPSRRSWEAVSEALLTLPEGAKIGVPERKLITSFVGVQAMNAFVSYLEATKSVDVHELLEGNFTACKKDLKELRIHEYVRVNEQIKVYLKKDFTPEQMAKITDNFYEYLVFLKKEKQNEVIGHLMSWFTSIDVCSWLADDRIIAFASEHADNTLN